MTATPTTDPAQPFFDAVDVYAQNGDGTANGYKNALEVLAAFLDYAATWLEADISIVVYRSGAIQYEVSRNNAPGAFGLYSPTSTGLLDAHDPDALLRHVSTSHAPHRAITEILDTTVASLTRDKQLARAGFAINSLKAARAKL